MTLWVPPALREPGHGELGPLSCGHEYHLCRVEPAAACGHWCCCCDCGAPRHTAECIERDARGERDVDERSEG